MTRSVHPAIYSSPSRSGGNSTPPAREGGGLPPQSGGEVKPLHLNGGSHLGNDISKCVLHKSSVLLPKLFWNATETGLRYKGEINEYYEADGKGILQKEDGTQYEGIFKNGRLRTDRNFYVEFTKKDHPSHGFEYIHEVSREGKYILKEGWSKDDKLNGPGFKRYSDGTTYEGEFKDDKPHGPGFKRYSDGTTYKGEFKDGKPHGKGVETYTDEPQSLELGSVIHVQYDNGNPVLRPGFVKNSNNKEKGVVARVCCLLLDNKEYFCGKTTNGVLKELLSRHEGVKQMLDFTDIDEYLKSSKSNPCLLNLTRDDHVFLLEVKNGADGKMELALYDSGGFLASKVDENSETTGKGVTCFKRELDQKDLFDVLNQLHSKKSVDEFITTFMVDKRLVDLPLPKSQKLQVTGTCALDSWLTYLKHNLDDHEFQNIRASLFLEAKDFFEREMSSGEHTPEEVRKLQELVDTAKEKFCRRVIRYVHSLNEQAHKESSLANPLKHVPPSVYKELTMNVNDLDGLDASRQFERFEDLYLSLSLF